LEGKEEAGLGLPFWREVFDQVELDEPSQIVCCSECGQLAAFPGYSCADVAC
jgi:hypothetical protein